MSPWGPHVVGPDVEEKRLFPAVSLKEEAPVERLMAPGVLDRVRRHLRGPAGVGFPQRMTFPVMGEEDPAQVGVAFEANPEEIVDLPLVPAGRRPEGNEARPDGIGSPETDLDAKPGRRVEGEKMVDQRVTRVIGWFRPGEVSSGDLVGHGSVGDGVGLEPPSGRFVDGREVFEPEVARRGIGF